MSNPDAIRKLGNSERRLPGSTQARRPPSRQENTGLQLPGRSQFPARIVTEDKGWAERYIIDYILII